MAPKIELEIGGKFTGGSAFDQADRRLANLGSESRDALGNLSELAEQAKTAVEALGVGLLVDRFVEWHKEIQKTIGDLKDQADAVGLTTDQLQAYQAAGREVGAGTETMQKVLSTFNVALGQAAAGEKTAADAFIKLKVPILDANGSLAGGGDYSANVPRIVGEQGWELDVPRNAGTILNQKQLASLLGGGQGLDVHIYLHDEMLDARVDNRVNQAAPKIIRKAASLAPAAVAAAHAAGGGEWRTGR